MSVIYFLANNNIAWRRLMSNNNIKLNVFSLPSSLVSLQSLYFTRYSKRKQCFAINSNKRLESS